MGTQEEIKALLYKYEMTEMKLRKLKAENEALFIQLRALEDAKMELQNQIKRLTHTEKAGPPQGIQLPEGQKSHVWAEGGGYRVVVTYKQASPYYNPSLLLPKHFAAPGVVLKVDTDALNKLAKKDPSVKKALIVGEWMTPALSIKPIIESKPEAE